MKIQVQIPLTLTVEVDLSPLADEVDLDDTETCKRVAESAADLLVTTEGLASPRSVTDTIHVDGFGKVRVTHDVGDIDLGGQPKVAVDTAKRKKK